MYRMLDHLERNGLISGAEVPQVGRPPRKVYRITDRGRKTLQDWFSLPPNGGPRPLRDELAAKLLFRADERTGDILDLVRRHRSLYLQHLSQLNRRRARLERTTADAVGTRLLLLQAEMRVRSDLAWLEIVEKEIRGQLDAAIEPPADPVPRR
jgi:DNA-binding PadR family transcriptional regulator